MVCDHIRSLKAQLLLSTTGSDPRTPIHTSSAPCFCQIQPLFLPGSTVVFARFNRCFRHTPSAETTGGGCSSGAHTALLFDLRPASFETVPNCLRAAFHLVPDSFRTAFRLRFDWYRAAFHLLAACYSSKPLSNSLRTGARIRRGTCAPADARVASTDPAGTATQPRAAVPRAASPEPASAAAGASAASTAAPPPAAYFHPDDATTAAAFESAWRGVCSAQGGAPEAPRKVPIMFGREIAVRRACGHAARFEFEELCGCPRGAPDYIAVAEHFDVVAIDGVPAMSMQVRSLLQQNTMSMHCHVDAGALPCLARRPCSPPAFLQRRDTITKHQFTIRRQRANHLAYIRLVYNRVARTLSRRRRCHQHLGVSPILHHADQ